MSQAFYEYKMSKLEFNYYQWEYMTWEDFKRNFSNHPLLIYVEQLGGYVHYIDTNLFQEEEEEPYEYIFYIEYSLGGQPDKPDGNKPKNLSTHTREYVFGKLDVKAIDKIYAHFINCDKNEIYACTIL